MHPRYDSRTLTAYAEALLRGAGLDADKAAAVAFILVEADLMGHTTHGLQLLAGYLGEIETGGMARCGTPHVHADFPAAVTWDGGYLPGPWLVLRALDLACERAERNGTCTVVIRRSHHIACLAAYLRRATDRGFLAILTCSDPRLATVAPHGGRRSLYTPDPIAAAWPTDGDPVILDISTSITSNGTTRRLHQQGRRLPGPWLIDAEGRPTDDPAVMAATPPGSLLPVGGADHGHKGYALALLAEALTSGLAGHGRADRPAGWTANVFLEVMNPALFGGAEDFVRQTGWLAAACRDNPPRPGFDRVRLPGEAALRRREQQLASGVDLHPGILESLAPWAKRLAVPLPQPGEPETAAAPTTR